MKPSKAWKNKFQTTINKNQINCIILITKMYIYTLLKYQLLFKVLNQKITESLDFHCVVGQARYKQIVNITRIKGNILFSKFKNSELIIKILLLAEKIEGDNQSLPKPIILSLKINPETKVADNKIKRGNNIAFGFLCNK